MSTPVLVIGGCVLYVLIGCFVAEMAFRVAPYPKRLDTLMVVLWPLALCFMAGAWFWVRVVEHERT